jgi:hypothetical protein
MIAVPNQQLLGEREQTLTDALRKADPEAVVRIEQGGQLSVSTVLDEQAVLAILESVGVGAAPVRASHGDDEQTGGCCGGCGCG